MKFDNIKVYNADETIKSICGVENRRITKKDLSIAHLLLKSGTKFLRRITVAVDITAPIYWWRQFNSVANVRNLDFISVPVRDKFPDSNVNVWSELVKWLEQLRTEYLRTGNKKYLDTFTRQLPEIWEYTASVVMTYEDIRNSLEIYCNKGRLFEWEWEFPQFARGLPYFNEIIYQRDRI